MDTWELRDEINEKIDSLLKEKFDQGDNDLYYIKVPGIEEYNLYLQKFKYVFSLGEDGKIYLWNKLLNYIHNFSGMNKKDFSKEEVSFLEELFEGESLFESRGDRFSMYVNYNEDIETDRLLLVSYFKYEELDQMYKDYLIKNPKEYEDYYATDYDEKNILRGCSQINNSLAFAILLKETKEYIGSVALNLKRNDAVYNLEYIIFPKYRCNGYAYEAINALINSVKSKKLTVVNETVRRNEFIEVTPNIKLIEANTWEQNKNSIKLLTKLGFEYDGRIVFNHKIGDKYFNSNIYHLSI